MDLALSSTAEAARTVVRVAGEVDVYTAPALRRFLEEQILRGCRDLVVDLSEVTFLDSTGLGVLVGRLRQMRMKGGQLRLAGPADRVVKVLAITGLDRVFDIAPTLEAIDRTDGL